MARTPGGPPPPKVLVAAWEDATTERRATAVDMVKCMMADVYGLFFVM